MFLKNYTNIIRILNTQLAYLMRYIYIKIEIIFIFYFKDIYICITTVICYILF